MARRAVVVLLLGFLLVGCAQTSVQTSGVVASTPSADATVLIMPTDIELYELSAGGLLEPQAAWTEAGKTNIQDALDNIFSDKQRQIVAFEENGEFQGESPVFVQLQKLHAAVGAAIVLHKYTPGFALPTKESKFDWSLGEGVSTLRETHDADYALFVHMRDSFSSAGRVALIMVGALLGVSIQGGQQVGFASLVDLQTGDVIWFNRLLSGFGDLRDPTLAHEACESLLSDLPI